MSARKEIWASFPRGPRRVAVLVKHGGLAVTQSLNDTTPRTPEHQGTITHLNTGQAFADVRFTEATARALVVRLATIKAWAFMDYSAVHDAAEDSELTELVRSAYLEAMATDGYDVPKRVLQ